MKTLIAAVAMSLVAGAAVAAEGNGNPFPFRAPPISVSTTGYKQGPGKSQDPFPFVVSTMQSATGSVMPSAGAEGVVQTANSAPPGSFAGVPSLNYHSAPPTLLAQPTVRPTHG